MITDPTNIVKDVSNLYQVYNHADLITQGEIAEEITADLIEGGLFTFGVGGILKVASTVSKWSN
jgi:hypothetical protein